MSWDVHSHLGSASGTRDRRGGTVGEARVGAARGGALIVMEDDLGCLHLGGTDRVLHVLANLLSRGTAECLGLAFGFIGTFAVLFDRGMSRYLG